MLIVHHLRRSQSERVIWLCAELGIEFELRSYDRAPIFAPADYKALHPLGTAPVITDGDVVLAESAAIVEYVIEVHGDGRLKLRPGDVGYEAFLFWIHFANGSFQPLLMRLMMAQRLGLAADHPAAAQLEDRLDQALSMIDARLAAAPYLAGEALTAADIMLVFSLTTMRLFCPFDIAPRANIVAYLARIGSRDGYRRAMAKGDPGLERPLA